MDSTSIVFFHDWFDRYVRTFYTNDGEMQTNIELKERHTKKVCENMKALGTRLGLQDNALRLAEVVALFHDIGRFEQYRQYRTFSDLKAENHGLIGVRVLEEQKVLSGLDAQEKNIVLKAVEYHNILDLPEHEAGEVLFYARMIRDADKLDAFDVVINYYEGRDQRKNHVLEDFPDDPVYTPSVVEKIMKGENISYKEAKTLNDRKLTYAAWIFDVNYGFTLLEIKRRDYMDRLFRLLPPGEDIANAHLYISDYIEKRLKEGNKKGNALERLE